MTREFDFRVSKLIPFLLVVPTYIYFYFLLDVFKSIDGANVSSLLTQGEQTAGSWTWCGVRKKRNARMVSPAYIQPAHPLPSNLTVYLCSVCDRETRQIAVSSSNCRHVCTSPKEIKRNNILYGFQNGGVWQVNLKNSEHSVQYCCVAAIFSTI